jgi:protein SCO1/2
MLLACSGSTKKVPIVSQILLKESTKIKLNDIEIYSHLNKPYKIQELKGEVYVVNFFFTTCTTICPAMERELLPYVNANKEVVFLSFTIDPEKDTVSVLKAHHDSIDLSGNNWVFLRTLKTDVTKIANVFLSTVRYNGDEDFYHTSAVILIDKKMKIRGIYDILNAEELSLFEEDLSIVKSE